MSAPRRGWSKQGARHYGIPYQPPAGNCYYCGVPDCTECDDPPAMLTRSDIIQPAPQPERGE